MRPLRVYLVDDSRLLRGVMTRVVEASGAFRVVGGADSVAEARAEIAELRPHVVTLDLEMPGVGGAAFLDELDPDRFAALVIVSTHTEPGSRAAAEMIARGADACFDKRRIVNEAALFVRTLRLAAHRRAIGRRITDHGAAIRRP